MTPGALAAEGTLARSHRLPGSLRLCVSQEALGDARVNARVRLPPGGVGTRAKTQRGDSMGRAPGEQRGVAGGGGRRAGLGTGPARGVAWCGIGWAGRGRAASTSPEEVCPEPSSPSEPRSQLSGLPRHPPPHLLCRCPQGRWILHSGGTGSPAAPGKSPGEDARERRVAELLHSAAFWNRAAFRISSHNLYSNEGHLKGVT